MKFNCSISLVLLSSKSSINRPFGAADDLLEELAGSGGFLGAVVPGGLSASGWNCRSFGTVLLLLE